MNFEEKMLCVDNSESRLFPLKLQRLQNVKNSRNFKQFIEQKVFIRIQ